MCMLVGMRVFPEVNIYECVTASVYACCKRFDIVYQIIIRLHINMSWHWAIQTTSYEQK